jgi:hypothetical protein
LRIRLANAIQRTLQPSIEEFQMIARAAAGLAVALALCAHPALAKEIRFKAVLSGDKTPTVTGSKATGQALIMVDTDKQAVSVSLDVKGLAVDALSSNLRKAPMGPIHLHVYAGHDHGASQDAALLFPLPYGPSYAPTADGFRVTVRDQAFAPAAQLVRSKATFDEFVAALQAGRIVLNIHTNAQPDGEISGDVVPAA